MTTTLVTGAAGFTGRWMIEALNRKGHRVVAAVRTPEVETAAERTLTADLDDPNAVSALVAEANPDYVVHLAALSFVGHADPAAFYRVNVLGTEHLLKALTAQPTPPKRVLIASSANVYGDTDQSVIDERQSPAPVNHYACSKLAMEHMARTFRQRLPLVIARPFNYTGPGQDTRFLIPKIVDHFARGCREIELGNTHVSRDFSDVRDVVNAYLGLLDAPWAPEHSGEVVNVCSGVATPLDELIGHINRLAGYEIDVKVNPAFVRANEIKSLRGSSERLEQRLGTPRQRIPLTQTLSDMLKRESALNG
ncbi:NAD-dependent epimerase/dehydratase family protein [Halomonas sp. HMF6819]|uniref:NAD-dependent epimerase/dehydratase family protein n=1 Tax=Halomonas sp. HMF6819 TaxID=3373085 RepID=UPI00379C9EAE